MVVCAQLNAFKCASHILCIVKWRQLCSGKHFIDQFFPRWTMCSSLLSLQVLAILSAEFRKTQLPKQILCFTLEQLLGLCRISSVSWCDEAHKCAKISLSRCRFRAQVYSQESITRTQIRTPASSNHAKRDVVGKSSLGNIQAVSAATSAPPRMKPSMDRDKLRPNQLFSDFSTFILVCGLIWPKSCKTSTAWPQQAMLERSYCFLG